MTEWQPIETIDARKASAMFGGSEWVLVATDDGRVTEARVYFPGGPDWWFWACARGANSYQRGMDKGFLVTAATHWMPLPKPPEQSS